MHLAATLKKLLTILLLLILAGSSSGYFHDTSYEVSCMQETEEKVEKSSEEKSDNEYLFHTSRRKPGLAEKKAFFSYSCNQGLFPVLDRIAPPPDVKF